MSGASLPPWARKGVKVVCVDSADRVIGGTIVGLSEGAVYTIQRAFIDHQPIITADGTFANTSPSVVLCEATNTHDYMHGGYSASRFRPAIEPKTEAEDVAMFHGIARQKLPEAV